MSSTNFTWSILESFVQYFWQGSEYASELHLFLPFLSLVTLQEVDLAKWQQKTNRSSHRSCSIKKCSWKFRKLHRKTSVPKSLIFNKVSILRLYSSTGVICEFCEIFKNTFFIEQLWTTASERSLWETKACKLIHNE